jgi:hypothetical protein
MTAHWTYLLVYSSEFNSKRVNAFMDKHPNITDWYICLPNSYIFVSDMSAQSISDEFRKYLGNGRFLILDTNTDRQGILPQMAWDLIKNQHR